MFRFIVAITSLLTFSQPLIADVVDVYDATALQNALESAQPGDEIVLQPGYYQGDYQSSGQSNSHFYSNQSGTTDDPIILRSYSKADQQSLQGSSVHDRYALYITGDHWLIRDLVVHTAQKGIVLDNANYNLLDNIQVHNIGEEAIHFRDSSAYNTLKNCLIRETGKAGRPGYGEGVYIGSDTKLIPNDFSIHNVVGGCQIGPGVSGEPLDVKENTSGTIIENNILLGDAIAGVAFHYADSFIDLKGDSAIVRNNEMDYKGNVLVTHGVHALKNKTHVNSYYYNNKVTLDASTAFVKIGEGTAHISGTTLTSGGSRIAKTYNTGAWDSVIPANLPEPGTYTGYSTTEGDSNSGGSNSGGSNSGGSSPDDSANCLNYTSGDRLELDLNAYSCIVIENDVFDGKYLQVWDSDDNASCNFRGTITDGITTETVSSNYVKFENSFSGNTVTFTDPNCAYVKIRAR